MKLCPKCGQTVAEGISSCPACGGAIGAGRTHIDHFRILEIIHEGHSSLLCHAVREKSGERVMIRLFKPESGVDEEVAARLGIAPQTLAVWRLKGIGPPFIKMNRAVRYRPEDIEAFISGNQQRNTGDVA